MARGVRSVIRSLDVGSPDYCQESGVHSQPISTHARLTKPTCPTRAPTPMQLPRKEKKEDEHEKEYKKKGKKEK